MLGVWATKLGEMAGVSVPLIAMHHAYVVTERIEGIQVRLLLIIIISFRLPDRINIPCKIGHDPLIRTNFKPM